MAGNGKAVGFLCVDQRARTIADCQTDRCARPRRRKDRHSAHHARNILAQPGRNFPGIGIALPDVRHGLFWQGLRVLKVSIQMGQGQCFGVTAAEFCRGLDDVQR